MEASRGRHGTKPYDELFERSPVPMWVCDTGSLRLMAANEAARALYGYGREEMEGLCLRDIEPTSGPVAEAGQWEADHLTRSGLLIEVVVQARRMRWRGHDALLAAVWPAQTQFEQRQTGHLVSSVVETAHEGILTIDDELTITSLNPAAAAMFGIDPERAVGTSLERFMPATFRDEYGAEILGYGLTGRFRRPTTSELLLLRATGEAFVGEAGISTGESDGKAYVSMVLRDVTRQKEAESALRDSEQRYHLLTSVAPVGIFRLDAEGRCIYANEKLGAMTGRSSDELLGAGWASCVRPEDQPIVLEEWAAALRTRRLFRAEVRLKGAHNRTTWVLVVARVEHDEEGAVRSYIGTATDISRRKAAEEALREREAQFQMLARLAPVGIFRLDAGGRCTYVNDRLCCIAGRPPEELLDDRWQKCMYPAHRERAMAHWHGVREGSVGAQDEWKIVRPDGTSRHVLASVAPEQLDGGVTGYIGTVMDISERKNTEATAFRAQDGLRQVAASERLILCATDQQGIVTLFEGRGLEALGYAPRDLEGRSLLLEASTPRGWKNFVGATRRALAGEAFITVVSTCGRQLQCQFTPVEKGGETRGMICIARDVTAAHDAPTEKRYGR